MQAAFSWLTAFMKRYSCTLPQQNDHLKKFRAIVESQTKKKIMLNYPCPGEGFALKQDFSSC